LLLRNGVGGETELQINILDGFVVSNTKKLNMKADLVFLLLLQILLGPWPPSPTERLHAFAPGRPAGPHAHHQRPAAARGQAQRHHREWQHRLGDC